MSTKHTRGPWTFDTGLFTCIRDSNGDAIIYGGPSGDLDIDHYDGLLIAAAPELLVLLREARAALEMWKDVAPAVSLCADIDAAIAKATGSQS